jgi:D-alanyl-D-alanine carboxypeptidase
MQRIESVMARIQAIQSQASAPPLPGKFRAVLDAQLAPDVGHARPTADGEQGLGVDGPVASMLYAMRGTVTLGSMLGSAQSSGPLRLPAGVVSAGELQAYLAAHGIEARNGHLGSAELVPVSGGWHGSARLLPPAAAAWEEMRAAAAVDGIDLRVIDSYRDYDSQARAHEAHLRGEKKANVLPPGHSEHGVGLAVDVTNGHIVGKSDPEWAWLQANARSFGWYPISNESWHWEFRGAGA